MAEAVAKAAVHQEAPLAIGGVYAQLITGLERGGIFRGSGYHINSLEVFHLTHSEVKAEFEVQRHGGQGRLGELMHVARREEEAEHREDAGKEALSHFRPPFLPKV